MKHPPPAPSILMFAALAFAKATLHKLRHGDAHHQHPSSSRAAKSAGSGARQLVRQVTQEEMQPLTEHLTRIGSQCLAEGLDSSELSSWHSTHPLTRCWSLLTRTFLPPPTQELQLPSPLTASASTNLVLKLGIELFAIIFVALSESAAAYRIPLLLLLAILLLMDAAMLALDVQAAAAEIVEPAQLSKPETKQHASAERTTAANTFIHGTWHKVDELSDSQEDAARMLQLGGLARTAMRMFKGMEITLSETHITTAALTKVPFLKVARETYALDGAVSCYPRRDMRRGNFVGYVRVQACGDINLYYRFEEPLAGHCCDEIKVLGADELHIVTHLTVGVESCSYRVVYARAGSKALSSAATRTPANGFSVELTVAADAPSSSSGSGGERDGLKRQSNLPRLLKESCSGASSDESRHSDGQEGEEQSARPDLGQPPLPPHNRHMRHAHTSTKAGAGRISLDEAGKARSADARLGRSSLDERRASHFSPARRSQDERRGASPFARVCGAQL